MVSLDNKLANVVGGKTARACDNCVRKRARWYCAADDAFLCQSCDSLVHSANPLACRHERVRLQTASSKLSSLDEPTPPLWHHGFTKKPRTPRGNHHNKHASSVQPLHLVPEIGSDDQTTTTDASDQDQMLYQVPVFDPFTAELAEFAADVESLLGKGLDEEAFAMEELGLGFLNCRERVKVEEDQMMREPFQLISFDYDSPLWQEKDEKVAVDGGGYGGGGGGEDYMEMYDDDENKKKRIILKVDYEGIIAAWDEQRSPWITGDRPELDPNDCWPECMGGCGILHHSHHPYGDNTGAMPGNPTLLDSGREARVLRYREKRRTRLFSKKIRYEVRKLNAEKRPRMKGRFVKRTTSLGFPLLTK